MAHEVSNAEQQKEFGSHQQEIAKADPETTPASIKANAARVAELGKLSPLEQIAQSEKMHIGGKTTKPNQKLRKGEKVDAGIPEVERRQESPNEADRRNPPVRLKWDGSGEETFKEVKRTGTKNLPLGSTVQPAPTNSQSISPDGLVRKYGSKRFSF
jgi:hypothetical protein